MMEKLFWQKLRVRFGEGHLIRGLPFWKAMIDQRIIAFGDDEYSEEGDGVAAGSESSSFFFFFLEEFQRFSVGFKF